MTDEDDKSDKVREPVSKCPKHPLPPPDKMSDRQFDAFTVAIGGLAKHRRKAFTLWVVYRYTEEELAKICGVSVETVVNHVNQGCKLLGKHRVSEPG